MSDEDYYHLAQTQFSIVGPQLSRAEIEAVIPNPFPGKEDLVQFYLRFNGGSRTPQGGVIHCGNPAHQVSRDNLGILRIEGFLSIVSNPEDRMLPFRPMLRSHAFDLHTYAAIPKMMDFFRQHIPIAFEHSGNYCYIDLQNGCVPLLIRDEWKEGPIEIAPSFREFVSKFWNIPPAGLLSGADA